MVIKRYLGSKISAYCACILPCFIIAPLIFGCFALASEISIWTVLLFLGCVFCAVSVFVLARREAFRLYSWGVFNQQGITIKSLFKKNISINYSEFSSIGIGCYTHGFRNPDAGIKVFYIFFSTEKFNEKYRFRINAWKPSPSHIAVEFDKDLYEHLLNVLQKQQSFLLKNDYKIFIGNTVE